MNRASESERPDHNPSFYHLPRVSHQKPPAHISSDTDSRLIDRQELRVHASPGLCTLTFSYTFQFPIGEWQETLASRQHFAHLSPAKRQPAHERPNLLEYCWDILRQAFPKMRRLHNSRVFLFFITPLFLRPIFAHPANVQMVC